jgi:hypothetical protein
MHLAITPDGPRGPRRQCAQGPIYLASTLQLPLVPLGLGYDRPWRTSSWDRFAVPRPFSRARAIMGPAITIPPHLDRSDIENCRMRVERLLTALSDEAAEWASSGLRREGEITAGRQSCAASPKLVPHAEPGAIDAAELLPMMPGDSTESPCRIAG